MKLIIYAEIDTQNERRADLLNELNPLIAKIRMQTGCVRYDWSADSSNAGRINVYEEWENKLSLIAHFTGENFKAISTKISEHGVLGAKARKFSINQEAPVFDETGSASADF